MTEPEFAAMDTLLLELRKARAEIERLKTSLANETEARREAHVRAEKAEAEIERMKAGLAHAAVALEHCKHRPHEHNPPADFTVTHCEVIDRALARLAEALK